MSDYPLEALLRLRKHAADEALVGMGAAVSAAQAEEREYSRLHGEVQAIRRRVAGAPPAVDDRALQLTARFQARQRATALALRERMSLQEVRLREAEAAAQSAGRALALARAGHEVLEGHRRRWLQERRAARDAAEEREAEVWLPGRPRP